MDYFKEIREEITKQVIETEDAFIIRTLYPYCHDILETKISKKNPGKSALLFQNRT